MFPREGIGYRHRGGHWIKMNDKSPQRHILVANILLETDREDQRHPLALTPTLRRPPRSINHHPWRRELRIKTFDSPNTPPSFLPRLIASGQAPTLSSHCAWGQTSPRRSRPCLLITLDAAKALRVAQVPDTSQRRPRTPSHTPLRQQTFSYQAYGRL